MTSTSLAAPTGTTFVVVGAGPGVGAAAARRFGREGFSVALISRTQTSLDSLAAEVTRDGTRVRGFAADVTDPDVLQRALADAAEWGGPVEVVQYSPIPAREFLQPVLDTTRADLARAVAFSVFGPVATMEAVLPGMRDLGRGTVVFLNGGSAVRPNPAVAGTSIAFAAEGAYAQMLHDTLAEDNIHVAQLVIPGAITPADPQSSPDAIADRVWHLHTDRGPFRTFQTALT